MLDFTSSLYLGLRHPMGAVVGMGAMSAMSTMGPMGLGRRPWSALSLGRPAALQAPPGAEAVARELAALQGCEAATLLPSTLHLFWDLFGLLARPGTVILVEDGTYAIARWGIERAAARGATVRGFAAADAEGLERLAAVTAGAGHRLLIVCDGFRPGREHQSPIARYAATAERHGGCLVLDDTQALGVLGHAGGGTLRRHGIEGAPVIVGASLAKGFGVPMAVLSGSRAMLRWFEARSETRVHTSPPTLAVIEAARHALALNRRFGDALRARLMQRVREFRSRLAALRLRGVGGDFPVQSLAPLPGVDMSALHAALLERQVRTVLHADVASEQSPPPLQPLQPLQPASRPQSPSPSRSRSPSQARLSFVITAAHTAACIERAVQALVQALAALRRPFHPFLAEAP